MNAENIGSILVVSHGSNRLSAAEFSSRVDQSEFLILINFSRTYTRYCVGLLCTLSFFCVSRNTQPPPQQQPSSTIIIFSFLIASSAALMLDGACSPTPISNLQCHFSSVLSETQRQRHSFPCFVCRVCPYIRASYAQVAQHWNLCSEGCC